MKKYLRFHRSSFEESIATMREVYGLYDLQRVILAEYPHASNVHISRTKYNDTRTPEEWGGTTHYILADFDGLESQCVGMCNFYER